MPSFAKMPLSGRPYPPLFLQNFCKDFATKVNISRITAFAAQNPETSTNGPKRSDSRTNSRTKCQNVTRKNTEINHTSRFFTTFGAHKEVMQ